MKYQKAGMFLLTALLLHGIAEASIERETAVKILIAEGANQGLDGMTAIAEVIRRREPSAFTGLKRKNLEGFIAKQPAWVHVQAELAWDRSAKTDLTHGATHYENVRAFGMPSWARGMKQTVIIEDHTFFKEKP